MIFRRHPKRARDRAAMYVLVRQDLPVGLQMAQAVHAAVGLAAEDPTLLQDYPTVRVLAVADEAELVAKAHQLDCEQPWFMFAEPDLNDEMTAFAAISNGDQWGDLVKAPTT